MPAAVTPVAAGRAISTRARKSSRVDEPSTSTAGEDESETGTEVEISKRDELRALLIGRLFAIMREQRDKTEATIHPREVSVEEVVTENDLKLAPINDHILQMEQTSCGMTLEDMLKDAKYATYSATSMNINEVEKDIRKVGSNRTLEPIEVKIEDSDLLTTASSSVLPSASQETNVERAAKREAHVLSRIAELRRSGLWSNSRLPKCVEPERNKTHWDYVLEEVKWMAVDFHKETKTKMIVAKKLAQQIARIHREKEIEVEKAVERELREKKKLCANVAKMVRDFWQGVDKVVDIRAKEILEARVRKARNDHLMFVIGQVNEMSNIVQEGLVSSKSPSISSRADDDKEFDAGDESESDDERTIANAEKSLKTEEVKDEVDALNTEANAGMDDFLASLPPEYLAAYGLTKDDLDDIRKENNMTAKVEEINEEEEDMEVTGDGEKEDGEMEAGTSAEDETGKKDNEKSQDVSAEDGNGDGRGVLENVDYLKLKSVNSDERQEELAHIAEEALKFQPKGYTLETTQVKTPVPFLIKGQLREYQMVGLDWMVTLYEKNLNGILADEMGLGKTIQTISLLAHLACSESIWGPHLIVVPTSVILNWEMEFKKWCPALKILTYFGSAKDRAEKRKGWTKPNAFHVCITSYKTVTQDIRSFKQRAWQYLILDEAQNIKNWKSQRWQALLNVRARRRLLLTGTPLQNSLMELWSLMHFLMPTIFSSHDDFKDWFSTPMTGMMEGNIEYDGPLIQRLHKVLRPFILRRLKKEVEKQLPEKTEHVVKCALSKRQRYLYDDFMSRRSTKENLKSGNMMSVLNIVMQLRKCCNHPNLFEQRPVVSPFVVPKAQLDLPAKLFGIQEREDERVPAIFDLTQRVGVWQTSCETQKKPLIEEIENSEQVIDETNLRPPIVEGFRFSRSGYVSLPTHDNAPSDIQESNNSEEEVKTNGRIDIPSSSSSSQNPSQNRQIAHIRTRTVVNTAPLTIATERCGFNYTMANSGSRQILDQNARFSPPLKKPKLTGSALNFSDYVPDRVIERIDAARRLQLEILRRRCGKFSIPILSNELIGLLRSEIGIDSKTKRDEKVRILLNDYIEMLGNRFGMYVEPVLSDAWQCRPSSSGLPSYIRNNLVNVETCSRTLLLESQPNLDEQMILSRRLQFPELRLIEYDCGKLQTLAILLRQLYVHKHRCLIFTQMSKMLDVLQTFLSHHGYQYFRLDGSTGVEQRQAMMERFNADPKVFCFILSTRSGGVGINLTGADTVIFYDSDWNPTMDAQAQDRCHRIGQTRNRCKNEDWVNWLLMKLVSHQTFFKQSDNIRDLFDGEDVDIGAPADVPTNEKEMEKALAKCEDEADVNAAKLAKAEARVDVAEFDESAKLVTSNLAAPPGDEEADDKYMELISQLKPIERYAINFLEEEYKPEFEEEVKEAEAMIEQKREEWNEKMNESSQSEEDLKNIENDDNEIFGEDFYLGGPNLLDEVRKNRRSSNNVGPTKKPPTKMPISQIKSRSPSKRKTITRSLNPYISSAHHAYGSPPPSPIKKKRIIRKFVETKQEKEKEREKTPPPPKIVTPKVVAPKPTTSSSSTSTVAPKIVPKKVRIIEPVKVHLDTKPVPIRHLPQPRPQIPQIPQRSQIVSPRIAPRIQPIISGGSPQRRLVVVSGSMKLTTSHQSPTLLPVRVVPRVVVQPTSSSSSSSNSLPRVAPPGLGIYQRPRLSLRARGGSESGGGGAGAGADMSQK
ncbi:unnamed protein product [Caenorhabditis angaria]|uniref:Uncharacterized protein n=1 Tax=Caenorhabditis angaria TaxID=860376 RepID=A0A9P1MZ82_9PELO|nr:unnamed protein product [Caenorhabditis angaria]